MFFCHQPTQVRTVRTKPAKIKRSFLLLLIAAIASWFTYQQTRNYFIPAKALIVLGGHEERERFAAQLAYQYPDLPIWVSSGSPKDYAERIFTNAGIDKDRLHLDYRASDTVTNFTTLVDELQTKNIDSVYLITSENHMLRARIIGEIVFGSRGILLKPIAVPSQNPPEPLEKCLRDGARSILWLTTGHTGTLIFPLPKLNNRFFLIKH
jgi:uncharacterized SAM-binding protein YcdF (DUF218 family)